jgi:hypothetical protein
MAHVRAQRPAREERSSGAGGGGDDPNRPRKIKSVHEMDNDAEYRLSKCFKHPSLRALTLTQLIS